MKKDIELFKLKLNIKNIILKKRTARGNIIYILLLEKRAIIKELVKNKMIGWSTEGEKYPIEKYKTSIKPNFGWIIGNSDIERLKKDGLIIPCENKNKQGILKLT